MSDEHVDAGSETPGEQPAPEVETPSEAPSDTPQTAGDAVEQKAGDACTCPDGRAGTLHDQEGTLVCLPNQG